MYLVDFYSGVSIGTLFNSFMCTVLDNVFCRVYSGVSIGTGCHKVSKKGH